MAEKVKSSVNLPGLTQDLPEKNKLVHQEGPSQNSHKRCVCVGVCVCVCERERERERERSKLVHQEWSSQNSHNVCVCVVCVCVCR